MGERKLATIRKVSAVDPIPNKDRIGLAHIDGWTVIVQKADIHAGDLVVFCEIDSVLPDAEWSSFLKDRHIKTMKMAGCLSQGIAFPLSILPSSGKYEEGDDVTEVLGVTKWERPDAEDMGNGDSGSSKRKYREYPKWLMRFKWFRTLVHLIGGRRQSNAFPSFVSETDETRIQNCPFYLDDRDKVWVVTEKVDGTSGTFAIKKNGKKFGNPKYDYYICSRNRRIFKDDGSIYVGVFQKYHLDDVLLKLIKNTGADFVCIQGECIGPKVQGNKYKLKEPELYAFNLITSDVGRWASTDGKETLSEFGVPWVPIIEARTLPDTVEGMLEMAHGNSLINPDVMREGLVCRSLDGQQSFKAVDPEFLIHYGE